MVAISSIVAEELPLSDDVFQALAQALADPPVIRLFRASAGDSRMAVGRMLEEYAKYIQEMSSSDTRDALDHVEFEDRFASNLPNGRENPFPRLFESSKTLHREMLSVLDLSRTTVRRKVLDWFLL